MKRIIALLLALLCLYTALSVCVYAADDIKDVLEEQMGLELEDEKAYGVVFQAGNAKTMYMPATQIGFDCPGYVRISEDYPIAIGKDFRAWKDSNGDDVWPGDSIYVDKIVYLTADWSNASTNVTAFDTVVCALKTMIHSIQIAIHVINTANEFRAA